MIYASKVGWLTRPIGGRRQKRQKLLASVERLASYPTAAFIETTLFRVKGSAVAAEPILAGQAIKRIQIGVQSDELQPTEL